MNKNEKLFLFYLVAILLFDAWAMSLGVKGIKNWHVYNYLTGLEMILLTLYLNMILKSKKLRNYLSLSCIGYFVYYTIHISITGINSLFMPLSMVSGLILSLFFLLFLIYGQTEVKWINAPDNWFALGSIFYLFGSIPFQALFLFLVDEKKDLGVMLFEVINMGLSHFRFLLIIIGFFMILKRKQTKPEIIAFNK